MNQDDAFLASIIENPDDDSLRLIYADWLDERGDPRSVAVRKNPEVSHFLANLRQAADPDVPLKQVEAWVFAGRVDLVRDLGLVLMCQPGKPHPKFRLPGVAESTLERVRQALCPVPDFDNAVSVIRSLEGNPPNAGEVRDVASRLSSEHSPAVLQAVLEYFEANGGFLDLLASLAQEMVLRGTVLAGVPAAERIAAWLREQSHPLAGLPLFITAAEGDLRPWLPRYSGSGGRSLSTAFGSHISHEPLPLLTTAAISFAETTDPTTADRISSAVRNWEEQSNGLMEVRIFRSDMPIGRDDLSTGLLRSLSLSCLERTAEEDIRAGRATSSDAFAILFSAAATGGAYNRGLGGAYGRLTALKSFAGLAGAPGDDVGVVTDFASRCLWVSFAAGSDWFCQIAWDLGLLAVRPDGMSLAVLAATDTD